MITKPLVLTPSATGSTRVGTTTAQVSPASERTPLRRHRLKRRLTQVALARQVGSSQSRIAKLESGGPGVSMDLLFRALFAAGATTADIARELKPRKRPAA